MDSSTEKNSAGGTCEFQQNLEILRQIEFFAGLPMETLKVFAYLCARESFSAQDYLYSKDDDDGQAFYVLSGRLVLVHHTDDGEETIREYRPGDFIGGLSLLAPMRRIFALKAGQATDCLVLSREKFAKAIGQFPDLIPRVFKSVADSIRDWDQQRLFEMTEKGLSLEGMVGISAI
jgi:CRP/FNR family transcriptional regulator, cyclic AMP receptor protein